MSQHLVARVRSAVLVGNLDGRRPAPLGEVVLLLLVILVFSWLHNAVGKDATVATANAFVLQSTEKALHVDIELAVNQWLVAHSAFILPAVYYYRLYYVAIIGVLLWVFLRHADVYAKLRRTLVAMTVLVLPVFWALPMSPPRFALPGVVDIVAMYDVLGGHASRTAGQNVYSAMPSMHVGWSLWCAYAVWYALKASHPRLALLSWIFPLGMAIVVLGTGNHYVLDIVGSVVLLTVSIAVVAVVDRFRRRRSE